MSDIIQAQTLSTPSVSPNRQAQNNQATTPRTAPCTVQNVMGDREHPAWESWREALHTCRAQVRAHIAEARKLRARANSLSGMDKHEVHLIMRGNRHHARNLHLASAYLRGIAYKRVEPRVRVINGWASNEPRTDIIWQILLGYFPSVSVAMAVCGDDLPMTWARRR